MESQGDKCESIAEVIEALDAAPVTAEEVKSRKIPHAECQHCKSLFLTTLGLQRHQMFCTAADQPWVKSLMPAAGFELDHHRPLLTFRGKPEKRFWLVKWKNIKQLGLGSGLDSEGTTTWALPLCYHT